MPQTIQVKNPYTGKFIPVEIAGDEPTADEAAGIQAWFDSQRPNPRRSIQTPSGPKTGTALDQVFGGVPQPAPSKPYAVKPVAGVSGAIRESVRRKQEGERIQSDIRMAQLNRQLPAQLEELREGFNVPPGLPTDAFSGRQAVASGLKKSSGGKALSKALGELISIPGKGTLDVASNREGIVAAMSDVAKFATGIPTTPEELQGLIMTAPAMVLGIHGLGKFAAWAKATAASDKALAVQIGKELGIAAEKANFLARATRALEVGGMDGLKAFAQDEGASFVDKTAKPKGAKGKAAEAVETPTPQAGSIPAASTKPVIDQPSGVPGAVGRPPLQVLPKPEIAKPVVSESGTTPPAKPVAGESPSTTPVTNLEPKVTGMDRVTAAKERLRARAEAQAKAAVGQGGGEVPLASNYNFSKEDWADLVDIGRGLIEAGHDSLDAFARQLVSHVGERARPAIRAIWDEVTASRATGLANQVQGREALKGIIDEIPSSGGREPEYWQELGERLVQDGANYRTVAAEISSGARGVTPEDFAVALAGKTRLMRIKEDALAAAAANPGNKDLAQAAANSALDLQNYLEQIQQGKGVWSDIGRALQAGTEIDTGNFAQVLEEAARKQGITLDQVPGWMKKKYESPTRAGAAAQQEMDRLKAELAELKRKRTVQTFKKDPGVSYSREQYKKDVTDAFAQFRSSMASTAASANDVLRVGGELTKEAAVLIYKVGWSTAKLGVVEAEALVKQVQKMLKDELGEVISDQEIIDAMAPKGTAKSRTELQREIQQLTQEFKRLSTQGKASALERVQKGIDKRKKILAEGKYTVESKAEVAKSKELEQKIAERKFYDGQVRAMLKKEGTPLWKAGVQRAAGAVRSLTLAQDVGVLTRQALFMNPLNNPIGYARGLIAGVKSIRSDKVMAQVMRELEERRIAGYHMGAMRKKYGLSLSDPHVHQEEIASLHELGEFGAWIERTFSKSKTAGHIGAIPGSLERFQTAFLNTARAESFDRAFAMGMTDQELSLRANFINSISGRSNVKSVPDWLSVIMTSPRYEKSRWEIPTQAIRNPLLTAGSLVKSVAKGQGLKGVNKAAAINSAQLVATAAEVYGLFKLAEMGGYTVNWDPTSGDFMKMRKGNDVWDVSAGLAPRIRDVIRLAVWGLKPEFNKNWQQLAGDVVTRTFSPGVRVPSTMGIMKTQEMMGLPVKDPWSGFKPSDASFTDWRALAPLTVQAFWQAQDEPASSPWWAFGREFVGSGVGFYPQRGKKASESKKSDGLIEIAPGVWSKNPVSK